MVSLQLTSLYGIIQSYQRPRSEGTNAAASDKRITISFYKYHHIEDPQAFRDELYMDLATLGVLGRIYVASEGINAQISVPDELLMISFPTLFDTIPEWRSTKPCRRRTMENHFSNLKILVRKKIVADGLDDSTFDATDTGVHVNARNSTHLPDDPNTMIVDMRNHYESEVGHFKNAICPGCRYFP